MSNIFYDMGVVYRYLLWYEIKPVNGLREHIED